MEDFLIDIAMKIFVFGLFGFVTIGWIFIFFGDEIRAERRAKQLQDKQPSERKE